MDNGDDSDEALPISQLAQRLRPTGAGYDTARRRIERAIREERLAAHRGYWGGRLLTLVYRRDFERWLADQGAGDGRAGTEGDDPDDDVVWTPDGASARLAQQDIALERLSGLLTGMQEENMALLARHTQPLVERLEAAQRRIGYLESQNVMWRERALHAEDAARRPKGRPWWAFWRRA